MQINELRLDFARKPVFSTASLGVTASAHLHTGPAKSIVAVAPCWWLENIPSIASWLSGYLVVR
jgi:hypothetical protein